MGIEFRRVDYSYCMSKLSFASGKRKMKTAVLYNGNSGLSGISMPSDSYDSNESCSGFSASNLFAQISFLASATVLLLNYFRVIVLACPLFQGRDTTFGAWVESNCPRNPLARLLRFDTSWRILCYDILLPLFSGICTASREEILNHPVLDFLGTMLLFSSVVRKYLNLRIIYLARLYMGWTTRASLRCSQQRTGRRRTFVQTYTKRAHELRHRVHDS